MSLLKCLPKPVRIILDILMKFLIKEARQAGHHCILLLASAKIGRISFHLQYNMSNCFDLGTDRLCQI